MVISECTCSGRRLKYRESYTKFVVTKVTINSWIKTEYDEKRQEGRGSKEDNRERGKIFCELWSEGVKVKCIRGEVPFSFYWR